MNFKALESLEGTDQVVGLLGQIEDHSNLKSVDPDKFPMNMEEALHHAEEYAQSLTGKKPKMFKRTVTVKNKQVQQEYKKVCNYSGKYKRELSLSIWDENIELYFLGSGYPMYFDFMKSCMLVLFLIFVSSGSFNIFSNAFTGSDCQDDKAIKKLLESGKKLEDICQLNWSTQLSLANKRNNSNLLLLQDLMNILSVITTILILQYLRTNQRALNEKCDQLLISPSDYTIWIAGILPFGNNVKIEDTIRKEVENHIKTKFISEDEENLDKFKVINVTVCYKLQKINDLMDQRAQTIEKLRQFKLKEVQEVDGKSESQFQDDLEEIKRQIAAKKQEYYDGVSTENNDDFSGHTFITVNSEEVKDKFLSDQDSGFCSFCKSKKRTIFINGGDAEVLPAPEPTDVNWNFLEVTPQQQFKRNIISNVITFFLLMISFGIILFLLRLQALGVEKKVSKDAKGKQKVSLIETGWIIKLMGVVISLVIPLLNYFLQFSLTKLSIFERHHRKTKEVASLGVKLAIAQFINTAVITFVIKVLFDFFTDSQKAKDNIYQPGGLVQNQQYLFITNSLIAAASTLVDGGRLYKIINRQYLAKKNTMTQRQLNSLYEEPEHNLAADYSGLMKTMLFTAFYAPLLPFGIILSIVGLIVLYIIQKYKVMNHRTIRYSMSNLISLEMIELMEYILPVYCVRSDSSFIYLISFWKIEGSNVSWFALLGIIIGLLNIVLPMEIVNELLFYVKPCPSLKDSYDDNIRNFQFDYDRANPATDDYARKIYVDSELKKGKGH